MQQLQPQVQMQIPVNPMQAIASYQMYPYANFSMNGVFQPMAMPQMATFHPLQKPEAQAAPSFPVCSGPNPPVNNPEYMSHRMKEFRAQKSRKWDLSELMGHLVELSGDQSGSRWLQNFLATASTQEKTRVFEELYPNALQLMQDVFGNYVIQKFFEYGDQMQKKLLGGLLANHIGAFSLNTYGCRVVQKAFEHVLADQQAALVSELNRPGLVFKCIDDQHGNHVVQKAIEVVPSHVINFIYDEILVKVVYLANHNFGCRIVQRMLEQPNPIIRIQVLEKLYPSGEKLINSTYGNYVAQHIISHGDEKYRTWMKDLVFKSIKTYGHDKFASNVVEKCIEEGTNDEKRFILDRVMESDLLSGEAGMAQFLKCPYGNYVVRKSFSELPTNGDVFVGYVLSARKMEKG
jgi:mRNA-binding protein PUF3